MLLSRVINLLAQPENEKNSLSLTELTRLATILKTFAISRESSAAPPGRTAGKTGGIEPNEPVTDPLKLKEAIRMVYGLEFTQRSGTQF
jgi:hypothetical protein